MIQPKCHVGSACEFRIYPVGGEYLAVHSSGEIHPAMALENLRRVGEVYVELLIEHFIVYAHS
jgi:hypothetical protein